jgi:hypothetical protein
MSDRASRSRFSALAAEAGAWLSIGKQAEKVDGRLLSAFVY